MNLARGRSGRRGLEARRCGHWARSEGRVGKAWYPRVDWHSIPAAEHHTLAFERVSIGMTSAVILPTPTWRRAILLYSLLLIALRDCLSWTICSSELRCASEPFCWYGDLGACFFFCTPFLEGKDVG